MTDMNIRKKQVCYKIGLMRHPPVDVPVGLCYGHMDVPLKEHWEQYAILPDNFQNITIYASPLSRCLKLAQKIAEKYQLFCKTDNRLLEFHFGHWEGKLWDDLPKELIDDWAQTPWEWQVPGGESGQILFDRVLELWTEIQQKQENVLIVSHAGPLRLLRQVALGKSVELLGELPEFGKLEIFDFKL
ncbi:Broad specificity phosphatase PhoE (PhoE) (PDB:1EBB) [Commensalibacter papalotli (ex Botero et al. 2024)]|uniref:Broad specificity phosphatase PhoE (PhoE) (PDB:1EBB) n=2 Tax=Commensalibacter papalotli (ex Botero et al. 2024) TaxID=2972766 RepID=A0ABN8WIJ8_9PROT|nr:Broad specificity phosphatase PhoE (PhoE) (PDB:1EBB) [Commensalibacter papalotli (ex Botero et al. 2024)]CAI3954391.1 Broad specificity phosphatase PhoE (PhoE) (PDB:1EBB) [Commensalibacter papalotli (ex Botero et al. 2024)]